MSEKTLSQIPGTAGVLPRAFLTMLKKPGFVLPNLCFRVEQTGIDPKSYNAFCRMFGFSENSVPLTYWHVRFFGLRAYLASHPEAPFPLPGMVHLSDHIRQYRPISPNETLQVECRFGRLLAHEKGTAFETLTKLYCGKELVWEENTVNLYLGKVFPCGTDGESVPIELSPACRSITADLDSGKGREYAKVSGDYNPIHLNTAGARLFGFKKHLLHGWYGVNRCLSSYQQQLQGKARLFASFKKPLFLPAQVDFKTENRSGEIVFEVADAREGFPHVKGLLSTEI